MKSLIIFIHGFSGDQRTTWGDFPDLMEKDPMFKDYDWEFFGYYSPYVFEINIFKGVKNAFKRGQKIQEASVELKRLIDIKRHKYDDIVLVCHSMGGLVAKDCLLRYVKSGENVCVSTVLFYATPHNGSWVASLGKLVAWKNHQLSQLKNGSDVIEYISEDWKRLKLEEYINAFYIIASEDACVDKESAIGYYGNENIVYIGGKGHIDVCKPKSSEDDSYKALKYSLCSANEEYHSCAERCCGREVDINKNSKKYIPEVYVDRGGVQEDLRYFVYPSVFRKLIAREASLERCSLFWEEVLNFGLYEYGFEPNLEWVSPTIFNNSLIDSLLKFKNYIIKFSEPFCKDRSKVVKDFVANEKVSSMLRYYVQHKFNSTSFYSVSLRMERWCQCIDLMTRPFLLVLGGAGKGKTNFVCDSIQNIVSKRGSVCCFLKGSSFNGVASVNYLDNIAMTISDGRLNWSKLDVIARHEFISAGKYLFVVIDGLNETSNPRDFKINLTQFLSSIAEKRYIKVLMTCRTKYFESRMSSIVDDVGNDKFVNVNIDRYYESACNDVNIVEKYFKFFNINYRLCSNSVWDSLRSDPLLLRFFCEVNSGRDLSVIATLNRNDLFNKYFDEKSAELIGKIGKGEVSGFMLVGVLKSIIRIMFDRSDFNSIEQLSFESLDADIVQSFLDEDILIKVGAQECDVQARSIVCSQLAFTFDEFRDFLIACYLTDVFEKREDGDMHEKLIFLSENHEPVMNGVARFLFYQSRNGNDEYFSFIKSQAWYYNVFVYEVFNLNDNLICNDDIEMLTTLYVQNPLHVLDNLISKIGNDGSSDLSIDFIVDRFSLIDDEMYLDRIVEPLNRYISSVHYVDWLDVADLCSWALEELEEMSVNESFKLLKCIVVMCARFLSVDSCRDYFFQMRKRDPDQFADALADVQDQVSSSILRSDINRMKTVMSGYYE